MSLNINHYLLNNYSAYIPKLSISKLETLKSLNDGVIPSFESLIYNKSGSRKTIISISSKFRKGDSHLIAGVYLDPSMVSSICAFKGACQFSCIDKTGFMPRHLSKRQSLTLAFLLYPEQFLSFLLMELIQASIEAKFKGVKLAFRFNGTSDIRIENILNLELLSEDLDMVIYDYTKYPLILRSPNPSYHLCYSYDEQSRSMERAKEYLQAGYPVAIVLNKEDKQRSLQFPFTVDGDKDDYRFKQGRELVILEAKQLTWGKGEYKDNGIIRSLSEVTILIAYITELFLSDLNKQSINQ